MQVKGKTEAQAFQPPKPWLDLHPFAVNTDDLSRRPLRLR
jgi:hypothetical protein